jgi:hypothetical protein
METAAGAASGGCGCRFRYRCNGKDCPQRLCAAGSQMHVETANKGDRAFLRVNVREMVALL